MKNCRIERIEDKAQEIRLSYKCDGRILKALNYEVIIRYSNTSLEVWVREMTSESLFVMVEHLEITPDVKDSMKNKASKIIIDEDALDKYIDKYDDALVGIINNYLENE